ncbi:MAG: transcriptional regulator, CadC [Caulobacteraceae bacterium]|nr:transcriptional regulator, CadC [Caulobacteraceae bacterium]
MGENLDGRRVVINLVRERTFRLGSVEVRPRSREVVGAAGREVLEPRVMQVLVALARAGGEVLTRGDLTASCWDGRIVGEDAINRVLSRLRRLCEGLAGDSWNLETISKVGYRLTVTGAAEPIASAPMAAPAEEAAQRLARPGRRTLLIGGVAALAANLAAAGGGTLWALRRRAAGEAPPADVAPLIAQAQVAICHATASDDAIAIGLLRQVTERHPEYAAGWGLLAIFYASTSHLVTASQAPGMAARAREAAERALTLEPDESNARLAQTLLLPHMGSWRVVEMASRAVLARHPDFYLGLFTLARTLGLVGRCREGAVLLDRSALIEPPTPGLLYSHVVALWAAGRLDEADRAMDRAMATAPRHYAVWFTRLYLLLYTGRAAQALGMLDDADNRPSGIGADEFPRLRTVILAIMSQDPKATASATALCLKQAHQGAGHAENSIQFACAMGQLDAAFAVAGAYFFGRGFEVADIRFEPEESRFTRRGDRSTAVLFLPSTAPMRADPRFRQLTEDTGLERYWRESHTKPDYRA